MNIHKIITSVPINKTAALVVGKGFSYEPNVKISQVHKFICPPLKKAKKGERKNPSFVNLTAKKVGRLRVIGMSSELPGLWVCKCDCGYYVMRTAKALKNPKNIGDRCQFCRHTDQLRRTTHWRDTGENIEGYASE